MLARDTRLHVLQKGVNPQPPPVASPRSVPNLSDGAVEIPAGSMHRGRSETTMPDTQKREARVEANKQIVLHVLERLSAGDIDAFIQRLAPAYVRHCQAMPPGAQEIHGRDGMRAFLEANRATFPDYHEEIEHLVGEGDFVAWRSRGRGPSRSWAGWRVRRWRRCPLTMRWRRPWRGAGP